MQVSLRKLRKLLKQSWQPVKFKPYRAESLLELRDAQLKHVFICTFSSTLWLGEDIFYKQLVAQTADSTGNTWLLGHLYGIADAM